MPILPHLIFDAKNFFAFSSRDMVLETNAEKRDVIKVSSSFIMEKAMTELAAEHFTPLIDRYTLVVITFSFVIHYSLFRFSSTSDEKDAPTRARYPSQAHALFVCGFVLWWMTQYDWGLWDDKYLMRMLCVRCPRSSRRRGPALGSLSRPPS